MQMLNINPVFNTELMLRLVELNKKTIIKNIIEEENKFDPKYKTELCKKFQNTGHCPYGFKCRFAHGKEELITKTQGANYKKSNAKHSMKKDIVHMVQDVVSVMMKGNSQNYPFLIIIFNYFYLKPLINTLP